MSSTLAKFSPGSQERDDLHTCVYVHAHTHIHIHTLTDIDTYTYTRIHSRFPSLLSTFPEKPFDPLPPQFPTPSPPT